MKAGSTSFLRACLLTLEAACGRRAPAGIFRLDEKSRAIFLDHLQRLDGRARRQRFGDGGFQYLFLESYVQNIDFGNTAIFAFLADGHVRGSAELRSLTREWGREAELAVVFETAWRSSVEALCGEAFRFATKIGISELHTYCDLAGDCASSFLRFLGKERGYMPCTYFPARDSLLSVEPGACAAAARNEVVVRLVRTAWPSGDR
jgi:hypothetical protein